MRSPMGVCLTFKQPEISDMVSSSESTTWESAMKKAEMTCSESGNVSDILKLELRAKIQLRRHEKGEDFQVEEEPHQIEYKLTPEDLERRKNLRERNKLSARKHRIKKKQENVVQQKDMEKLSHDYHILKKKVEQLESVKAEVLNMLSLT